MVTCSHEIRRRLLLGKKAMTDLDSILKSRDITLPIKVHLVKAMVFPVVMYGCELNYKESWVLKNWCFWTLVLEKTLRVPWTARTAVHPKGDQSWVFIGRSDAEAETPILWPPDEKSWLIWEDPDAGKDWGQEKGMTEYRWLVGITDMMDKLPELVMARNPGMLQSMGLQRVGHDWATELTDPLYLLKNILIVIFLFRSSLLCLPWFDLM